MYLLFSLLVLLPALPVAAASFIWQSPVEIATGAGDKGPWQQNDSRYDYVDDPAVLLDDQGNVAIAWVDQAAKDVLFRTLSVEQEHGLSKPVNISRSPQTFSWLPRMARAPDAPRSIYIVWQEIIFSGGSHGGDILFARSTDNGATFSQPVNVSRSVGGDGKGRITAQVWHNGSFDIAAGPNGTVYLAWTEYDGALWFSRSADGGASFSAPRRIAGEDDRPARAPSLAVEKNKALYLAWTTGEDAGADIQLAKSTDRGASFGRPQRIAPDDRYSDAPKLAIGPDGTVHLVYAESNGGPFANHQVLYTRSADGGHRFRQPRIISHPLPAAMDGAAYPSLQTDAAGRVYVIYEHYPHYRRDPRGLGITVSLDGGISFSTPQHIPGSADHAGGTNGSHQGRLMKKLAVNREGRIAVVNSSLRKGQQSRVWLMQGQVKPHGISRSRK